eukprot:CAMPEP_0172537550 /NCGR_PEP_ID=MMETSP1067-20121228/9126_1 /TAXON_ID=265564 ORGANISM="Thalassiosira punctigera, Strain Tpunct2005C2" /NCGR_SAMPLE_ID=MMETSP1067 /ASSEMBLY_ACC=CAM_ASM_000444 /LENGTH=747 /DNA_ID=CAMNT_0013322875 /DNA_START=146 /DNA_END=2386 /DNA_ORIENTATION=+
MILRSIAIQCTLPMGVVSSARLVEERSLAELSPIFPTPQFLSNIKGRSIAIGDVNGDGFNDIVFGNDGGAGNELYLNDGGGNIPSTASAILPGGSFDSWGTIIGDFNNDTHNDIFFANLGAALKLLINDGNGNFPTAVNVPIEGYGRRGANSADFNGDGNLDIVITAQIISYGSAVLLGDGAGGFTNLELDDESFVALEVDSADFDNDGDIDLVIVNDAGGANLFLNDGNDPPVFTRYNIPYSSGTDYGNGVVATDVNKDGRMDFIVTRYDQGSNLLFLNDGVVVNSGVLEATSFTQSELPGHVVDGVTHNGYMADATDVNGDGWPDIVIGNYWQENQLLLNSGGGGFNEADVYLLPEVNLHRSTRAVKLGDVDGDSMPDLVIANDGNQHKFLLINALDEPPSEDLFQIIFTGLDANFTSSSDTELSLTYDIGKNPPSDGSATGRYKTALYEKDCTTKITTNGAGPLLFSLTDNGRITKSPPSSTFDAIKLFYDANKTLIAESAVWNATTNKIEICQVVQQIEKSPTLGEMVIEEDKRVVTIDFDLSASFDVSVDLEEAALTSANTTAGVQDYVNAYKCDGNFDEDNSPLVANDELYVCIESSSADVEISEVETMTIKQSDAADLPVIVSSIIQYPAISEETVVSPTKQAIMTRVPSNIYDFSLGNVIDIEGLVIMQLVGSTRRMLQVDAFDGGSAAENAAASFDVNVALQLEATPKDATMLNSAATSFASKLLVPPWIMILALAVW